MSAPPFCPTCRRDESVEADGVWLRCDACGASWIPDSVPVEETMPDVETPAVILHRRSCACRGTGWLGYPGIGPRAHVCESRDVLVLPLARWDEIGRPATADEVLDARG